MTITAKATATPSYRRAYVQPREITRDPAFTVRGIREDHVRTLYVALRNSGRLDPVLVWEDLRDPDRPRLVLLDGQHILAAYENQRRKTKVAKGIPVRIVTCDEITAHRLAAQRNSRDKLPLTFAEKMNLAWRLVWLADAVLSKADIVGDTGASRTTVHNMRQRRRAMIAAGKQPTGEWWRDAKDTPPEQPEETDNVLTPDRLARLPDPPEGFEGLRVVYAEGCTVSADRLKASGVVFKQIPYQVEGV